MSEQRRKRRTTREAVIVWAPPLIAALGLLAVWQIAVTALHVPVYLLPGPLAILEEFTSGFADLVVPTLVTVQEAYFGFVIAAVLGFVTAVIMARSVLVERAFYPWLVVMTTVPHIAIAPLFVVWFGAGLPTNTLIAVITAVFPIVTNTLQGLKSTEANLVQLYRMAGASRFVELISLRVPAGLPYTFAGLRVASGTAVIAAIVGEFVAGIGGGKGGLGYVITVSAQQLQTTRLFAAVVMASVIALVLFGLVAVLEKLVLGRWHESAMDQR